MEQTECCISKKENEMKLKKRGNVVSALMVFALGLLFMPYAASGEPALSLSSLFSGMTVQNTDKLQVDGIASALGLGTTTVSGMDIVFVVDDSSTLKTVDPANYRNNAFHDLLYSFTSNHDAKAGIVALRDQQNTALLAGLQKVSEGRGALEDIFENKMKREGTSLAIGEGIKLAVTELSTNGRTTASKMIVLVISGASTSGTDPEQEAKNAADKGYIVNIVYLSGSTGTTTTSTTTTTTTTTSFIETLINAGKGKSFTVSDPHNIFSFLTSSSMSNIEKIEIKNETNSAVSTMVNTQLGAFTGLVSLAEGSNTITVTAHATDGTTKTQTVQVTKQGTDPCTSNPDSCISSRALKLRPQILMAGFDPIILDLTTTKFKVVALVREGANAIRSVSLTDNSGSLKYAMSKIGSLSNGDLLYGIDIPIDRGESFSYTGAFGSEAGQFNILITDTASQTQRFPNIEYGDNADLSGSTANPTTAAIYSQKGCKRLGPQVIMAGFDPPVLDYSDTGLKVKAIVRDGSRSVSNVKLSQSSGSVAINMTKVETLQNGDHLYEGTLTFERGSFPSGSFRNLWGASTSQIMVEARDDAAQKHKFPDLKRGDYASMNSADCWADQ